MFLKYIRARRFFIIPLLLSCFTIKAQNLPNSETAPAGTVATFNLPPEPQLNQLNAIRTFEPRIPITDAAVINSVPPAQVSKVTIVKDGFQRTVQTVQENYSFVDGEYRNLININDNRITIDQTSYLPYSVSAGTGAVRMSPFSEQKTYYSGLYPDEGYTSFSKSKIVSDAFNRQAKSLAPGKSQMGQDRSMVTSQATNTSNEVRIWRLDASGLPVSNGSYNTNELFGTRTQSPVAASAQAPFVLTYTNKSGRVVMRKETDTAYGALDQAQQKSAHYYRITYYVYDDMGRLRYTLPPKAVLAFENNAWVVTPSILHNLCFQYRYDSKGRLSAQMNPGEDDFTYIIYDRLQRPVMRITPAEKAAHKIEVTFYDKQDRVIATAIYNDAGMNPPEAWQSLFDTYTGTYLPNDFRYYLGFNPEGQGQYPPLTTNNTNIQSYTYYDDYSKVDPDSSKYSTYNSQLNFSEVQSIPGAENPVRSTRTRGQITGSTIKIQPSATADPNVTGNWTNSYIYYDDKGRVINSLKTDVADQNGLLHFEYSGTKYDFLDRPLIGKRIFKNILVSATVHTDLNKNEYEPVTGQLTQTKRQINGGAWNITGIYKYDDMGRAKRTVLGSYAEVQDFAYNIRGQLVSINGVYTETGNKESLTRSFGEVLNYDYGFNLPRYDGKIAGMKWRGSGEVNAYGYSYDMAGRLKSADYRYKGLNWSNLGRDYTVSGILYDKNGNLKAMDQKGLKPGVGVVDMDFLRYNYEDSEFSNRLGSITDNAGNHGLGDFVNTNAASVDYSYTENGFLKKDANKGIDSIGYTHFNKPTYIKFSNGNSIEYTYDAAGNKIMESVMQAGQPVKHTQYIGGYVYENNVLQYSLSPQGRSVYDNTNSSFKEEYFVKDHLGNIRSTVEAVNKPLNIYLATYEIASANLEGLLFEQLNEIRDDNPSSVNPQDVKSGRLNGADPDRRTGTSLLMHVMAEDQVEISVNNFYDGYDQELDEPVNAGDMLESIVSTLTGGAGGLGGSDSHNPDMVEQLFGPDNYMNVYEEMLTNTTQPERPKAYLNYMLFDESMKLQTEFSKAIQVNGNGSWQTIGTNGAITIPVNGYLAVYLSTRTQTVTCMSCGDVFFDQLQIKVQKQKLLEETHYYPHGLPMVAMSSPAENNTKTNRHKYQGNEYVKDLGLNWMDFDARQYDPQIGRFLGVDPMADAGGQESLSPYAAMGNAPESMIDPNGTFATASDLLPKGFGDAYTDINAGTEKNIRNAAAGGFDDNFGGGGPAGGGGSAVQENAAFYKSLAMLLKISGDEKVTLTNVGNGVFVTNNFSINGSAGSGLLADGGAGTLGIGYMVGQALANGAGTISASAVIGSGGSLLVLGGGAVASQHFLTTVANGGPIGMAGFEGSGVTAAAAKTKELVDKMSKEIDRVYVSRKNPIQGYAYELRVKKEGNYKDVRGNSIHLKAGDIWKYGESVSEGRYQPKQLKEMVPGGVYMNKLYEGTQAQIKVFEKYLIYGYYFNNAKLPPGNSMFR